MSDYLMTKFDKMKKYFDFREKFKKEHFPYFYRVINHCLLANKNRVKNAYRFLSAVSITQIRRMCLHRNCTL